MQDSVIPLGSQPAAIHAVTPDTAGAIVANGGIGDAVADAILGLIGSVPRSAERQCAHPAVRAQAIARSASARAAMTAGGLALPPGPLAWLTIFPELIAVWKLQSQMIADIARVYGGEVRITREHMVYCLFRHTAAQAVRDLAVRVGERMLVQQVSLSAFQAIAHRVGVHLTQRALGQGISRWLPVIGAVGVAAYAFYDTRHVARTAIELFEHNAGSKIDATGEFHALGRNAEEI
jgi:hypothetical protein